MKLIIKIIFIILAVGIGLYPIVYLLADMTQNGLLASKGHLMDSTLWVSSFYVHISFGAVAMLTGWSQFFKKIRAKRLNLHRTLGKIYVISVLISGSAGLYIAWYALGGSVSRWGFLLMDLAWLSTTIIAYVAIRKKDFISHENWMIRSYAVCWAAVTLRLWIPLFMSFTNMEFVEAYRIIAWLSWVPNLIIAEIIISQIRKPLSS